MRDELSIRNLFGKYSDDKKLVSDISKYVYENNNLTLFELEDILNFIYSETALDINIFKERPCVLKRRGVVLENDIIELSKIKEILKSEDTNRKLYIENNLDVSKYINDEFISGAKTVIKRACDVIKYIVRNKDLNNDMLESLPKIVVRKPVSDIEDIVDYIKDDDVLDINIINIHPTILTKCNKDKIMKIKKIFIKEGIDLNYLNNHPEVFTSNSQAEDIEKMIKLFKNTDGLGIDLLLDNPTLINRGNVCIMEKLIQFFSKQEDFGISYINKYPTILRSSDYDMVVKRFNYLVKHKELNNQFLWNNPFFIYSDNFDDIDDYIDYFKKLKFLSLDDLMEEKSIIMKRSLDEIKKTIILVNGILKIDNKSSVKEILCKRSLKEIEEIVDFIEDDTDLRCSFISNNPKVLTQKKPSVLKKTYKILKKLNISDEDIKNCVTLITYGGVNQLEALSNAIYDSEDLNSDILSNCLTVLAKGNVDKLLDIIEYFKDESEIDIDILNKCPSLLAKTTVDNLRDVESYFKNNENHSLDELIECPSIFMGTNLDNIIDITLTLEELGMLSLLSGKIYTVKAENIKKIYTVCDKFKMVNELKNTPVILRENPEIFYARVCYFKDNNIDTVVTIKKTNKDIINRKLICSRKKFENTYGITTEELLEKYPYDSKVMVK